MKKFFGKLLCSLGIHKPKITQFHGLSWSWICERCKIEDRVH